LGIASLGSVLMGAAFVAHAAQPARNARAPAAAAAPQQPNFDNVQIRIVHVQGRVYLLNGAGGNTTVQIGDDGVLVVDTQFAPMADKIVAAIRTLSDKPIRYVVNTHSHPDHVGGNQAIASQGASLGGANVVGLLGNQAIQGAKIIAHENVLNYLSTAHGTTPAMPSAAWPTDTYFQAFFDVYFNNEDVRLFHVPNAHTDGDSYVYFRGSDVIATGDIFTTTGYPFIDHSRGGNVDGIIAGLNSILDLAVTKWQDEGGTMIIPGHGRITDKHEVLEYRDMLVIIRDRIRDLVAKGMTLEQVRAAKPTLDYDPRFGADSGFWTTAQFVEAVYQDVSKAKK
jgi:glyoxylase-like metal-dependent hydrolase (beta-lactamase superfamily II)